MSTPILNPKWKDLDSKLGFRVSQVGRIFFDRSPQWVLKYEDILVKEFGPEAAHSKTKTNQRWYTLADVEDFASRLGMIGKFNAYELDLIFSAIDALGNIQLELNKK